MTYRDLLAAMSRADSAETRARTAEDKVARVAALHAPVTITRALPSGDRNHQECAECGSPYPCRTSRELNK